MALAVAGATIGVGLAGCTSPADKPLAAPAPGTPGASREPSRQPVSPTASQAGIGSPPTGIRAKGAALADSATMQLLWTREPDTERPIGSIAKVMTALVVLQSGGLNREIKIPRAVLGYVAKYQGESAGLRPADILTVHELLEALLLQSACDAAYVLATSYGPGMPKFLAKMNAEAAALGMKHTHFTSPDGLPYPTEYSTYSTPADLLALGMAAMKLPVFRAIVSQRFYNLARSRGHHAYWWGNTNDLIGDYQGADGIKTGYTDAAGHCLLFEAVRHGVTLIGVVLGSPATGPASGSDAAARLLDWGFGLKLGPNGA
jgi:serine-type D-Ala-D-Ala carboxypeptidase (penicillin-binding protein 5/6)